MQVAALARAAPLQEVVQQVVVVSRSAESGSEQGRVLVAQELYCCQRQRSRRENRQPSSSVSHRDLRRPLLQLALR